MPYSPIASAVSGLRSHCAECFCLAWTAGLLAAFLDFPLAGMGLSGAAVLAGLLLRLPKLRHIRKNTLPLILIAAGLLSGTGLWQHYKQSTLEPLCALDGETVSLRGTVTHLLHRNGDRDVYTLRTELCDRRVSVDWYAESGTPALKIGDAVSLDAVLTRITEDYASHTASQQAGYGKYLRIYKADILDITEGTGFSLSRAVSDYRDKISQKLTASLSEDTAALMNGMLFGDITALSDDARDALYAAGIGHITAVSGLHLVFFSTFVLFLLKLLPLPARLRLILNAGAIGLFILLVDGSASVWRAALMLLLSQSAVLFGRYGDTLRGLCLAMFLCTAFAPYVIGAAGFWLSVSGVLGIGVIAPALTAPYVCRKYLQHLLRLCIVSAAVFPASVLLLGQGSLLAPLCNLVILPFGTATLCIGFLVLCTGGLAAFLLPLAEPLCRFLLAAAKYAAKLPFSQITVSSHTVRLTVLLIALLMLVLLAMQRPTAHVVSAFCVCCLILFGQIVYASLSAKSMLQIALLGKGTDSAAVILCSGEAYAADFTGSVRSPRYVEQFLEEHDIRNVQMLLCTSPDNLAAYQTTLGDIGRIYDLSSDNELRADRGALSIRAESGRLHLTWNGISAEILPASDETPAEAQIVVRYGGTPQSADRFVKRLSPALPAESCSAPEYGGQNRLIRITADGRGDILFLE